MVFLRVDPHKGAEIHSLETSLNVGTIELDVGRIRALLATLKKRSAEVAPSPNRHHNARVRAGSTSRLTWAAPLKDALPVSDSTYGCVILH